MSKIARPPLPSDSDSSTTATMTKHQRLLQRSTFDEVNNKVVNGSSSSTFTRSIKPSHSTTIQSTKNASLNNGSAYDGNDLQAASPSSSSSSSQDNLTLVVGGRVTVPSFDIIGTLRFMGSTHFKPGIWAGIELDTVGTGKNDGTVQG